ncbi:Uncharacterised protein [Corynebacterium striatum]|nr:Uncharacterised protein [Corynebacterium striatum]
MVPVISLVEIPPRARRRVKGRFGVHLHQGNTSACAEKRMTAPTGTEYFRKYLRVRGEERAGLSQLADALEIPPRARRRVKGRFGVHLHQGNTSACAEKRMTAPTGTEYFRKYLRVRGEERAGLSQLADALEIPPRARRRACLVPIHPPHTGNTSACAEKSMPLAGLIAHPRKYLRVRGEEPTFWMVVFRMQEIPPRARRRVNNHIIGVSEQGNTSACAEKSSYAFGMKNSIRKYLRVRGEERHA